MYRTKKIYMKILIGCFFVYTTISTRPGRETERERRRGRENNILFAYHPRGHRTVLFCNMFTIFAAKNMLFLSNNANRPLCFVSYFFTLNGIFVFAIVHYNGGVI